MKNTTVFRTVSVSLWIAAAMVCGAAAAEENLDERVDRLERENRELRGLVDELRGRLERLEGEEPTDAASGVETAIEETVDPEEVKEPSEWLPSIDGETFRLGGRLQFGFYDIENETQLRSAMPESPGGSFEVEEFRLYLDADFSNKIRFYSASDFENAVDGSGIKEAYVDFEELPLNTELRLGLQPRFMRPGRYTENYPLAGTAFWRSRVLGVDLKNTLGPVYTHLSAVNGPELRARRAGIDDSSPMVSDNESDIDANGDKELGAGIGLDLDFGEYGRADILGFGASGELSGDDVLFLQTEIPGYGQSADETKNFYGANLEYKIGEWDFFAQAIQGQDGEMERFAWYSELSYKFEFDGLRYLNSLRPLVRYSSLDTDLLPRAFSRNGSLTWDRRQWLFGMIAELVSNVDFRAEYALNDEDTGGPEAQNNEMLFQLQVRF